MRGVFLLTRAFCWCGILCLLAIARPMIAQEATSELAATLEVLEPGVEVLRVNTNNWISVNIEAIVGVGDHIRTDDSGEARITFFVDGVDTVLLPNTEYRINQFEGAEDRFNISAEVLVGQTTQRVERILDISSTYDINTPGMSLTVRGTEFAIRVEDTGRSALLVSEAMVVTSADDDVAEVEAGFGIRSAVNEVLSDVVAATSFDQLDSALDGCQATVQVKDDVRLNVRIGPDIGFPRVGTIDPATVTLLLGVSEPDNWYRLPFQGGFGWILTSDMMLNPGCAGLRVFPDTQTEDVMLFEILGDVITLDEVQGYFPDSTAEPEASGVDD